MDINLTLLTKAYNEFNYVFFENKLPSCTIQLNKAKKSLGMCEVSLKSHFPIIKISNYYDREYDDYMQTLLHEMIHALEFVLYRKMGHGDFFKQYAKKIDLLSNGRYKIARINYNHYKVSKTAKIKQPIIIISYEDKMHFCYPIQKDFNEIYNYVKTKYQIIACGYITDTTLFITRIKTSSYNNGLHMYFCGNYQEIIKHLKNNYSLFV